MWTEEQELHAVRKESVVRASVFRQVCRFAALAVVLTAVAFHLARLLTIQGLFFPGIASTWRNLIVIKKLSSSVPTLSSRKV